MAGARICICHQARLFGECMERALSLQHAYSSLWVSLHRVVQGEFDRGEHAFDLVILDAAGPRSELVEVISQTRRAFPCCKLLLLVSESAAEGIVGLAQLGSQGCLRENGSLDDLFEAIRLVLDGKSYFSPELANALFLQLNGADAHSSWTPYLDSTQLTCREQEILRLIAWENLSNKQIARRLHVSLYTVKNHVHNIIEKLDVSDRHGAARLAQRRNLIPAMAL
jgi:DNA-binding NarL/FixJ family response regulator